MAGYRHDPEATAATLDADGWLHTGDVATVDKAGCYTIVDRLKELIKYKGYQVAPAELEAVLVTHREVLDAAVVAAPDTVAGEIPKAYVVRRPGSSVSGQSLMSYVAERVAPYKKVRRVSFVSAIPKSASGKILRSQLHDKDPADR
jgi:acyl-CoA synthetase (AMP-forming)/AMP-acid ligase II